MKIAVDTSAIPAIVLQESEGAAFQATLAGSSPLIGAPTLVEARLVLEGHCSAVAEAVLHGFIATHGRFVVSFCAAMFEIAIDAFTRFGEGRGHPATLNFGDGPSYAVARTHAVPLLFKGDDFVHTDFVPAYAPTP